MHRLPPWSLHPAATVGYPESTGSVAGLFCVISQCNMESISDSRIRAAAGSWSNPPFRLVRHAAPSAMGLRSMHM
ncbi:protein of unknown function [Burkholderia multivorans]